MVERSIQFEAKRARGIFKKCARNYEDIVVLDQDFMPVMKFRGYWDVLSEYRELLHLGVQVCAFKDEEMKRKVIENGFGDPYGQYFSVVCESRKRVDNSRRDSGDRSGSDGNNSRRDSRDRDAVLRQAVACVLWDMRGLLSSVFGVEYRREEEDGEEMEMMSMDSYLQQNWKEILEKNGWVVVKM